MDQMAALRALLLLIGDARPDQFIEVRFTVEDGMAQKFFGAHRIGEAAKYVVWRALEHDVYVGAAPRNQRAGGREAVSHVPMLWVDCDGDESVQRLAYFDPSPSIIIRSGSGRNVHAWWPLTEPLDAEWALKANRRLAHAVGGDYQSCDATRILRPPHTWNHKHDPAPMVQAIKVEIPPRRFDVRKLVGKLDDPPLPEPKRSTGTRQVTDDPLLGIPATEYVPALTGHDVNRANKTLCPFHGDGSASLHCYDEPARGWKCYGCGAGGSIYDFGARLWGIEPRGDGFLELRRRLREKFDV